MLLFTTAIFLFTIYEINANCQTKCNTRKYNSPAKIKIHQPSWWFFIRGYNPLFVARKKSCSVILPYSRFPQISSLLERIYQFLYCHLLYFSINFQLICYIFGYRLLVFPHRIYIVSTTPEFPVSILEFHICISLVY